MTSFDTTPSDFYLLCAKEAIYLQNVLHPFNSKLVLLTFLEDAVPWVILFGKMCNISK